MYGERIKDIREEMDFTQYKISTLLGLNKKVYGQYEREYVVIPLKHLINVCNILDVSLDYAFGFNDVRQYKDVNKDCINLKLVGERLKEFRKNNNLKQTDIAEILLIDQPTWSIYENGKCLIGTPFLYTICSKYNVSADYLLGRTNK